MHVSEFGAFSERKPGCNEADVAFELFCFVFYINLSRSALSKQVWLLPSLNRDFLSFKRKEMKTRRGNGRSQLAGRRPSYSGSTKKKFLSCTVVQANGMKTRPAFAREVSYFLPAIIRSVLTEMHTCSERFRPACFGNVARMLPFFFLCEPENCIRKLRIYIRSLRIYILNLRI